MFLGTAHEQAHAPPYAQNIGAHLLVFKDFIAKYDVKNVEFFALAAPARRDVPKRTVGFGQSGAFGEADISQTGRIHPAQRLTLALGNTAKAKGFNQTVEGALHLDTTDRHRGGGDRGEHDLSFQGHYQR
jgi:hypothetical protein